MGNINLEKPTGINCCICGNKIQGYGNNAMPLKPGICCDDCNVKVITARLHEFKKRELKNSN